MGDLRRLGREVGRLTKGRRRRYSANLKRRILRAVGKSRDAGQTWSSIVDEVGVPLKTLRQWMAEAESANTSELKPVAVVPAAVELPERAVVVQTPDGFRIEGLDVDGAAVLVRKLSS